MEGIIRELIAISGNLPPIDASVGLRNLIRRVAQNASHGQDLRSTATALVAATGRALDRDVWVQLDRAAHKLQTAVGQPAETRSGTR